MTRTASPWLWRDATPRHAGQPLHRYDTVLGLNVGAEGPVAATHALLADTMTDAKAETEDADP